NAVLAVRTDALLPTYSEGLGDFYAPQGGRAILPNNEVYAWETYVEDGAVHYKSEYVGTAEKTAADDIKDDVRRKLEHNLGAGGLLVADAAFYVYMNLGAEHQVVEYNYGLYKELQTVLLDIPIK
ncbi:MAG: hypothetical protein LBN10_00135, partial [Propionibacteriaceae bacterium]|nr:hypothetical protein [Propionibacteriaceae bacterium]